VNKVTVWLLHNSKTVLVDDGANVPFGVTHLSPDTIDPSKPTLSEILIDPDTYKTFRSWKMAGRWARRKAEQLGYEVDYSPEYPYGS
jgi:uncharacterized protein YbaP (TraB family)